MCKEPSMRLNLLILILILFCSNLFSTYIRDANTSTVLNTQTLLMWQDDENVTSSQKKWIDAINYCNTLTLASKSDWRLPNINELNSIIDNNNFDPSINEVFSNVNSSLFWSSTTYIRSSFEHQAWNINFRGGTINQANKTTLYYVRCVRDFN